MFSSKNVKIDKHLLERCKKYAEMAGYSSVDEFVAHAVENELKKLDEAQGGEGGGDDEAAVMERLRGLGYIE
jgi:metal-responsive CopG/Arc/MetJ family transcriptional regulator